jgi:hypothetical protein
MDQRKTYQNHQAQILLILLGLFAFIPQLKAQQKEQPKLIEKNIEVGMWVQIKACKANQKHVNHIDLYTKTRFPDIGIKIDSLTGEGVYENFFTPGDFDGKRLPCQYAGKKYRVAALREFEVQGEMKRIMFLYTDKINELIWVEFDTAVQAGEVTW